MCSLIVRRIRLGPPSVALFEIIVAGLFEKVVVIDSLPPSDSNLQIAGMLAPSIVNFEYGVHQYVYHRITYRVTLYSPTGADLGAWEVDGTASVEAGTFPRTLGNVTRIAMRRAAARFVKEFRKEPVVTRWLEEAGVKSSGPTQPQNTEGVPP
jgi:hypothetical protein